MDLRKEVAKAMPQVPEEKVFSNDYPFYFRDYTDNLVCPMGEQALHAYGTGSGNEIQPKVRMLTDGTTVTTPAKMASIASSSAMTFNLLGNDPAVVNSNLWLPMGTYQVQYEKQMHTLDMRSNPANLDAFLSDEEGKIAIFCEMKLLEWLNKPGNLKENYLREENYFASDDSMVNASVDAYDVFRDVIADIRKTPFTRYDVWQMFKHLLAIYNYTSFTTKKAVNLFHSFPSMAGKYDRIILANVVNEFPPERITDGNVQVKYLAALQQEQDEAIRFIGIVSRSGIPQLFFNNCNARIEVKYMSAKTFADCLKMTDARREYLKRYF